MQNLRVLGSLLPLLSTACLELPSFERPDAPAVDDTRRSGFEVVRVEVESFDGRRFPLDAVPRRPRIVVTMSARADPGAPVFLFLGPPSEELATDLGTSPLRESSLERLVAMETTDRLGALVVTPTAPLAGGAALTLAVAAWATAAGTRLGTPALVEVTVATDPALGAAAVEAWPPDRLSGIGPVVPLFAVRFDGLVEVQPDTLTLRDEIGDVVAADVRAASCSELGWLGPSCAILSPRGPLAPGTEHTLALGAVVDGTGAPLPPFEARVTTGEAPSAPVLRSIDCAPDETALEVGCALSSDHDVTVRVQGSEPLLLTLDGPGGRVRAVLPRGDGAIALVDLLPDAIVPAELVSTNASGLSLRAPLELATTAPLAALSIAEVRADPLGREPTQEYVELVNLGPSRIDLGGMHLSDSLLSEGDELPAIVVPPGARVLVVAAGFDADDASDGVVPPGVALVRVDGSIGSGGLSSHGEPLFLRDADDHRLSAAPARTTEAGACLVRVSTDPRSGNEDTFVEGPCTPGTRP